MSFEHLYQHLQQNTESAATEQPPAPASPAGDPGQQMNEYAKVPDEYLKAVNALLQVGDDLY